MEWKRLLSKRLLGQKDADPSNPTTDGRSQFQRDFDRVVFSSAFRRLQDKTQVFPLPENDFVHTRLTHSLEVSCVGRSLGNIVGERIIQRNKNLSNEFTKFHFGEIIAAACLAHDIGNPPFGHSGEDSIREYFKNGNGKDFEKKLKSKKEWEDFAKFEGNAQGFRIITKLQNPNVRGGLMLTCATLSAFTKYPKESLTNNSIIKNGKSKLYKKFGFFQSEKNLFSEVADVVGLEKKYAQKNSLWWDRHPLTFLVEAADDICYRIMDLEDGFRLGLLSFKDTETLLMSLTNRAKLKSYNDRNVNDKIGYLRAKAISNVINHLAEIFCDEEKNILDGKFEEELISVIPASSALEEIKKVSIDKIYSYRSVVEREAAGYEVLAGLLDIFITAVNEAAEKDKISWKSKTILKLLPGQFLGKDGKPEADLYSRLIKITDFVSRMTDSYAVSLYRKIKGISLPGK